MFQKRWLFHPQYSPRSSRRHIAHQALTVHSSSLLAIHPCPQNNPLLASEWDTCGRQYNTALKWKKYLFVCNGRHHTCLSSSLSECVWFQIRLVPLSHLTICVFWCADVESIWDVSWLSGSAINPKKLTDLHTGCPFSHVDSSMSLFVLSCVKDLGCWTSECLKS